MGPLAGAAIGVGANLVGSLLGEWWADADDDKRKALEEEAYRLYGDISAPTLERVLAEQLGPSAMEGLPQDFGNRSARNLALQQLLNMGLEGGVDAGSQLALEQGRRAAALQEQQGRAAVRQEAQRRGLGGAGEVVGQVLAQQAGADRASMGGLQAAADARQRALAALAQGGSMAGQAEAQDFGQAAAVAAAKDRIAQFNAEEASRAKYYNSGLQQQEWQNQLALRDRQYGAKQQQAAGYGNAADRKRAMAGGIGQAVGYGANAYGQYGGFGGAQPQMTGRPATPYEEANPGAVGANAAIDPLTRRRRGY